MARHRCLVVHPGIVGDRGPSALDWAICDGETEWGVTVLRGERRDGRRDVWASVDFPMREATQEQPLPQRGDRGGGRGADARARSASQRGEQPRAARRRATRRARALAAADAAGRPRDRLARDDTATVLRKIRAADGAPGVLDDVLRRCACYLFDAHPEGRGRSGRAGRGRSRNATARSCARRSTARSGSRHLQARERRRRRVQAAGGEGCWATGSPACPRSPLAPEATRRPPDLAADPLRGARAASATCTSPSTTAR